MNNTINNKKIVSVLGVLAILVLGILAVPAQTHAQYSSVPSGYIQINGYSNTQSYPTYYYPTPTPIYTEAPAPAPTPVVYSNTNNPSSGTSAPKAVAKAKAAPAPVETTTDNKYSDLAANTVFGSNGFMPSGIVQWLGFAILVILAVILVRKIYGGAEKYHAVPMKHS